MRKDILKAISKENNVNNVIILTHNIDFIFIQTVVLRHLKKCGNPSLTIFADAQCVYETYENQKDVISGLGKRYRVVPVSMDRAYNRFHPKAVLLSGADKASLYVGSGNLTFGGWRQNAEIWNSYDSEIDGTGIFHSFQEYLHGILERLSYKKNIDKSINEAYDPETKNWARTMEEPTGLIGRINTKYSLLEQMKVHLETGCERLIIQSPYFDKEGKTISQLNENFQPKRIEVFAQNRHSELTQHIIDSIPTNTTIITTDFMHYADETAKRAFIHAKFYAFVYPDKVVLFSGSANCSQSALAMNNTTIGNAELMSVHTMSVDEFTDEYIDTDDIKMVDDPYTPMEPDDTEEENQNDDFDLSIQILSAQYEYKQLSITYKSADIYEVIGCQIEDQKYHITPVNDNFLVINQLENEPSRFCLLLKHRSTGELSCSKEAWIDHERELSTSAKTRSLSDFIQGSGDMSWNHNTWGALIKVFNEHLSYTPKKIDSHALDRGLDQNGTRTVFNANDVFMDSYTFQPVSHILESKHSFDINAILRQYLGLNNLYHQDEEVTAMQTQEELEEQAIQGELPIEREGRPNVQDTIDDNARRKIKRLIESLTGAFKNPEIIGNRPLPLVLDDLKVASIILRMGLHKKWISDEEYFDATYTIWTVIFFSYSKDKDHGYIDFKLDEEEYDIEELRSPELSATMLAWLFAVNSTNTVKYVRFIMSAILVHAKYNWVFQGGKKDTINEELNKALLAIIDKDTLETSLKDHANLGEVILKTGKAFSELIIKLSDTKVSDLKDKIQIEDVSKGELLWQGKEDFYIVKHKYRRNTKKKEARAEVISINSNKEDKQFVPGFTIPLQGLFSVNNELITADTRDIIINFINTYLLSLPEFDDDH